MSLPMLGDIALEDLFSVSDSVREGSLEDPIAEYSNSVDEPTVNGSAFGGSPLSSTTWMSVVFGRRAHGICLMCATFPTVAHGTARYGILTDELGLSLTVAALWSVTAALDWIHVRD